MLHGQRQEMLFCLGWVFTRSWVGGGAIESSLCAAWIADANLSEPGRRCFMAERPGTAIHIYGDP
jgi:hypothetical protein